MRMQHGVLYLVFEVRRRVTRCYRARRAGRERREERGERRGGESRERVKRKSDERKSDERESKRGKHLIAKTEGPFVLFLAPV